MILDLKFYKSINKFVELSTGTPEDYRRLIRGDDWKTPNKILDIYGLDPFVQIPAIKIKYSPKLEIGSYVVPQSYYLLQKSSMGLFYLLAEKEKERALTLEQKGKNDFRESFGKIYRVYVEKQLLLAKNGATFIDLDEDFSFSGKKPDFAIIKNETCILFEVKTTLLTIATRTFFDEDIARNEILQGGFKKAIEQLNELEKSILNKNVEDVRFKNVKKVIKIMVGFEDIFLANAFLLPLLREIYGENINNLQIATITDIEVIGNLLSEDEELDKLILEKIATLEIAEWSLGVFLNNKRKNKVSENPVLKKSYEDFMSKITGKDYIEIVSNKS